MRIKAFLSIVAFITFSSCKTNQFIHTSTPGNELFKVSILYANAEGKTFDMDYYEDKHMPMVAKLLGKNLKLYGIDRGIAGRTPNEKVPFLAIGYFYVKDVAEYNKTIGQNRDAIINDFKNYTNIQPVVQISEVKKIEYLEKGKR